MTELQVFITDKKLNTYFAFDQSTHMEYRIVLKEPGKYDFHVDVNLFSQFDPRNPESCREYHENDYQNCRDQEVRNLVEPLLGCMPPWISPNNVCQGNIILDKKAKTKWKNIGHKFHIEYFF